MKTRLALVRTEELRIGAGSPLAGFYKLSPYVWREQDRYHIMLRGVNPSPNPVEKIARVYHGIGEDGLCFRMDREPAIAPGTEDDRDGCEDPTVVVGPGSYIVYYSGWNQQRKQGALLYAAGGDIRALEKRGRALPGDPRFTNCKECTIANTGSGYRMFFEYSHNSSSLVGVADSESLTGPWAYADPLFLPRPGMWDCRHLSPGPIIEGPSGRPIMFYNGADSQARWRIGCVEFRHDLRSVYNRCDEPLIVPSGVSGGDTDIAFAASAVDGEQIELYYSVSDRFMNRAIFRLV